MSDQQKDKPTTSTGIPTGVLVAVLSAISISIYVGFIVSGL